MLITHMVKPAFGGLAGAISFTLTIALVRTSFHDGVAPIPSRRILNPCASNSPGPTSAVFATISESPFNTHDTQPSRHQKTAPHQSPQREPISCVTWRNIGTTVAIARNPARCQGLRPAMPFEKNISNPSVCSIRAMFSNNLPVASPVPFCASNPDLPQWSLPRVVPPLLVRSAAPARLVLIPPRRRQSSADTGPPRRQRFVADESDLLQPPSGKPHRPADDWSMTAAPPSRAPAPLDNCWGVNIHK